MIMRTMKQLLVLGLCLIIAVFPLSGFADELSSVDLSNAPLYTSSGEGYEYYDDELDSEVYVDVSDDSDVSTASLEVYDNDSVVLSGNSDWNNFASFRMRFGRKDSSTGELPLSYDDYFSLGASFFTDSDYEWGSDLTYNITLGLKGGVYYYPEYTAKYNSSSSVTLIPDVIDELSPHSFTKYYSGTVAADKGLDNAVTLGYSDRHSWSYWIGADSTSEGSFSDDSDSDLYCQNYGAVIDASDTTVELKYDMGDKKSDLGVSVTSDDTVNFSEAYANAVSSGLEDFYFGLTLSVDSLSMLEHVIKTTRVNNAWESWNYDYDTDLTSYSGVDFDRNYDTPLKILHHTSSEFYGVYYSLIPVDSDGNELEDYILGPYLFNEGQDLSDLDFSCDYKVRLEVYFQSINLNFDQGFQIIDNKAWFRNSIPYYLCRSSSEAISSYGADYDFYVRINNLSNFVVTPTIYADGVTNSDILNSVDSNFTSLRDLLDANFEVTISGLNSINNNITSSTSKITSSISSAASSINNQLVDSTDKINSKLDESTDEITNGYDSTDMDNAQEELDSSLKDLQGVEDSEITDPNGNKTSFFDYIKSVFSSWSWPSFTTEFTNALKEIATLLNDIYSNLPEPFQTVIFFLILFTVLAIVLNFYKYYSSG